jgi:hypothetical protein
MIFPLFMGQIVVYWMYTSKAAGGITSVDVNNDDLEVYLLLLELVCNLA